MTKPDDIKITKKDLVILESFQFYVTSLDVDLSDDLKIVFIKIINNYRKQFKDVTDEQNL